MADTYTPNLALTLMARGDRDWDATLNAILTTLDAQQALGALAVRTAEDGPSTSLNVRIGAGTFRKSDGTAVAVAAVPSLALAASSTSSVYLTDAGAVTVSTSGFPAGASIVPLAVVTTGTGTVTGITDARRPLTSFGAAIGGSGTVTSVSASVPAGLSVTVGTATTTPAIAITTTLSGVLKGTGSGFAAAVAGTDYVTPSGSITGTAANVTGTVAIAHGGTGAATAAAAFDALSPNTTLGDITYASAANTNSRLAGNTAATRKFLTQTGTGTVSAAPAWAMIAAADMPVFIASGASHAAGAVPDPGATAGTTKFLREDATWAVPAGGSASPGGSSGQLQYNDAGAFGGAALSTYDPTGPRTFLFQAGSSASVPLVARGVAGQSDALFKCEDSAGNDVFHIWYDGSINAAGIQGVGSNSLELYTNENGTSGLHVALNYYNGAWLPAVTVANVSSGLGTLQLMPDGGTVACGATLLGFYGATPVAKAPTPATLADVIALLQNLGLCS